jgi:monoterpene epsilon-lactone hydrolase
VRVDLQIWPEMIHVWHLFHPELKAGQRGLSRVAHSFERTPLKN